MHSLILGGARSGKSGWAEQQARAAQATGRQVLVIATATAGDSEMQERITRHRAARPADWTVVEEPLALAATLQALDGAERVVIVDCLTLWLSNLLFADEAGGVAPGVESGEGGNRLQVPPRFHAEQRALLACLPQLQAQVLLVSNEVGMGIVPATALSRFFADEAGRLHQALARQCSQVLLMVAGLPLQLKPAAGMAQAFCPAINSAGSALKNV